MNTSQEYALEKRFLKEGKLVLGGVYFFITPNSLVGEAVFTRSFTGNKLQFVRMPSVSRFEVLKLPAKNLKQILDNVLTYREIKDLEVRSYNYGTRGYEKFVGAVQSLSRMPAEKRATINFKARDRRSG